jgi:Rps23 Pro-64 3,4-dihydroxylase Tpa1-like proline 4-hydroxylase
MRKSINSNFELADVTRVHSPFNYLITPKALRPDLAESLLSWFETSAPWFLVETDFYEQYEFSFFDHPLPASISDLITKENIDSAKSLMEELFETQLSPKVDFTAHKLLSGQRIRIHNDYIPGMETHRLIIQLNRGWIDDNGGMLMLFNSRDPKDLHRVIRPVHNSAVAFEISKKSNHAVSTIHAGERFTLVYSFYEKLNA